MRTYVINQFTKAIIVFILITLLVFSVVYYLGSEAYWGPPLSDEGMARLKLILGIDGRPFIVAYGIWLGWFFTGDWGTTPWDYSAYSE